MKILIVSDTHRQNEAFIRLLRKIKNLDMVVHCGDIEGDTNFISRMVSCPIHVVRGNNDFLLDVPKEEEFTIGNYRVWLTHGHNYYVSMNYEVIKEEARARGIDIVMCGHTHKPVIDIAPDLTLINPGSLSYPRQEGRKPSYIVMEIDKKGEAHYALQYL